MRTGDATGGTAAARCAADLRRLDEYAAALRRLLAAVDQQATPQTWSGTGGDRLRAEWAAQRRAVLSALADAEAQGPHLQAAARREDETRAATGRPGPLD